MSKPPLPPRLASINRSQLVLHTIDLEYLIDQDHSARSIWELVGRLNLSLYHAEIAAVEGRALVLRSRAPRPPSMELGWHLRPIREPMEQCNIMSQDDQHAVVQRLRSQDQEAKETLAALLASIVEIAQSSSITIKEGCLMYSEAGLRLLDTNYAIEQVAQYRAARERKEALRKRLIELGDPDPGSWWST